MVVILGFCHYQVALHKSTAKRKKESNVKALIFNRASIEDSVRFEGKEAGSEAISRRIFFAEETVLI